MARGLPDLGRLVEGFVQRLDDWTERLGNAVRIGMRDRRAELAGLAGAIPRPDRHIAHARSLLKSEVRALKAAGNTILDEHRRALNQAAALLQSTSYERVLERGFVLVTDDAKRPVVAAAGLTPGMGVTMRFHDGEAGATVNTIRSRGRDNSGNGGGKKPGKKPKKNSPDDLQGTLL
jgi:exodeoxyribonuclease VII large subunit